MASEFESRGDDQIYSAWRTELFDISSMDIITAKDSLAQIYYSLEVNDKIEFMQFAIVLFAIMLDTNAALE